MAQVTINDQMNGIEVRFEGKPAAAIIEALKENGFRWSGRQKMWYAKQNADRLSFAGTLGQVGGQPAGKVIDNAVKSQHKKPQYNLWTMTRTDEIEDNFAKYRIYNNKEIASIIRKHLRERFPMCGWSVRSDRLRVDTELKSSPFAKDSDEVAAIVEYAVKFAQSYNYDNSDSMTDYFDVNFYGSEYFGDIVRYDYEQTELTVEMMNVAERFQKDKAAFEEAEAERLEREWQEQEERNRIEREEAERREAEWQKQREAIEAAAVVADTEYFVRNAVSSRCNKLNSVDEIRREMAEDKETRQTCKVTRDVYLPADLYEAFASHLLDEYTFLEGMGGSATDDLRINSMTDYTMMTAEESETVEWYNTNCVGIFCDDKLMLVIDPQGYSYARYTYLVDDTAEVMPDYKTPSGITEEEHRKNRINAQFIEDRAAEIIGSMGADDWDTGDNFTLFKSEMKSWLAGFHFRRLTVGAVRAIENERIKTAMYKILTEVDGITEQFCRSGLVSGQKITLYYFSDFGGIIESRGTYDSFIADSYAQYDDAVKLIYRPEKKRNLYYKWFYKEVLVYDGWQTLPESVLWDVSYNATLGVTTKKSKYLSCDRKQLDDILEYFRAQGKKPMVNTYKPDF